jgi:hypothetical protein
MRLPFTDLTGGFKCRRRQTLEGIGLRRRSKISDHCEALFRVGLLRFKRLD